MLQKEIEPRIAALDHYTDVLLIEIRVNICLSVWIFKAFTKLYSRND